MEGTPLPSLKAKRAQNKQKKNPNLISYRSIFTRGSLCSRWTLQTKNNRKDIEWKIRFIFYFHIQKFQTRYSHTTSIPPNSERNVLERRYSEEGAVGSSHLPPLPSCSLSPTFIMVYFFQFITNRVFEKTFMCCWYEVRLRCSIVIFAQPPALLANTLDLPQTRAVSNLMKASNF